VIDLYFEDASGIKGKEQVVKILEAQLLATHGKLTELRQFERDLKANIARMKTLIEQARKHR